MSADVSGPSQNFGQNVARIHCFSLQYVVPQKVPTASKLLVVDLDVVRPFLRANAFTPSRVQVVRRFSIRLLTSSDILGNETQNIRMSECQNVE
jgi:hypothetical protein